MDHLENIKSIINDNMDEIIENILSEYSNLNLEDMTVEKMFTVLSESVEPYFIKIKDEPFHLRNVDKYKVYDYLEIYYNKNGYQFYKKRFECSLLHIRLQVLNIMDISLQERLKYIIHYFLDILNDTGDFKI